MIVSPIAVETDPAAVGLDAERLTRIGSRLRRYVDDDLFAGWLVAVARKGKVAYVETYGNRDREAGLPMQTDTIFRMASMTKPITAVAAMMLWEEGAFELRDPIHKFIPSFKETRVWRGGTHAAPVTGPLQDPVAIWHLLTHTSGLTYGFLFSHPVDAMYRAAGFEWGTPPGKSLEEICDMLAAQPLLFQPGAEWNYSMATDVLGRVIEVVSGQTLDDFFRTRIFEPLGMVDTAFWCPPEKANRLAAAYVPAPGTKKAVRSPMPDNTGTKPMFLSGGGGLLSTARDYQRFAIMLSNGGSLEEVRLLSPRTIKYMASNHLPGNADLSQYGRQLFAETSFDGVGFGLGVSVTIDPVKAKVVASEGDFGWGGAHSTWFMVDPVEQLTALFLTQLLPSSTHPVRSQLKPLIHQAIVG